MSVITAEDLTTKLLTIEDWVSLVQPTENLQSVNVPMDGTGGLTVFSLPSGWNLGLKDKAETDLTEAKMRVGDDEYSLTKGAALAVANSVGIPPGYVMRTPGPMIQNHLNYWALHSPDVTLKFLVKENDILAVTKEGITPFSNLELLDRTLTQVKEKYGLDEADLQVDYKSHHDLSVTSLRLIVPEQYRNISSKRAGGSEDRWSAGIQVRNSLTGKTPLSVQGYLFAWYCTNGQITYHSEGRYNRKIQGQSIADVHAWTSNAVDTVIESMEGEFDSVESLVNEPIGDGASKVLTDVFKQYKVPLRVRNRITDALVESDDFSYYGLANAISQSANDVENLPEHYITAILEVAGDVAHTASQRCEACKRVLV